jgi:hypothetical protein
MIWITTMRKLNVEEKVQAVTLDGSVHFAYPMPLVIAYAKGLTSQRSHGHGH